MREILLDIPVEYSRNPNRISDKSLAVMGRVMIDEYSLLGRVIPLESLPSRSGGIIFDNGYGFTSPWPDMR